MTDAALQRGGPGPGGDNILINGKNKNNVNGGGSYSSFQFTPGKKHLLRLTCTSVDNPIRVSIDGHTMQVVTSDLVPVKPITVDSVLVGVGQRYNVIVTANQTAGNYWMRAEVERACFQTNGGAGRAIVNYASVPLDTPSTNTTVTSSGCLAPGTLEPWVKNNVGSVNAFLNQSKSLNVNIDLPGKLVRQSASIVNVLLTRSGHRRRHQQSEHCHLGNKHVRHRHHVG